jgi:hypothetical protein
MIFPHPLVLGAVALPRNPALRARLKLHLDADPELLAALLVHLELARDDVRPWVGTRLLGSLKPDGLTADTPPDGHARSR